MAAVIANASVSQGSQPSWWSRRSALNKPESVAFPFLIEYREAARPFEDASVMICNSSFLRGNVIILAEFKWDFAALNLSSNSSVQLILSEAGRDDAHNLSNVSK